METKCLRKVTVVTKKYKLKHMDFIKQLENQLIYRFMGGRKLSWCSQLQAKRGRKRRILEAKFRTGKGEGNLEIIESFGRNTSGKSDKGEKVWTNFA